MLINTDIYEQMLSDLESSTLEVAVFDCKRVVLAHNCAWYRRLCHDYGTMRQRKNGVYKWETHVKRQRICEILRALMTGEEVTGLWVDRIKEAALAYHDDFITEEIEHQWAAMVEPQF